MEKTPLELYETAYKLHYTEHRIADAVVYYQRLIKEFPDASECGYAAIQLQNIKARDVAADLDKQITGRKQRMNAAPFLLVVCIGVFAACGYYISLLSNRLDVEQRRAVLAENALSKFSRGNHEDALALLAELKMLKVDDIMPYELSADVYRADKKYDLARREYATFFQLNPALTPTENEQWFMELSDGKKVAPKNKSTNSINKKTPPVPPVPASKKTTSRLKRRKKKVVPPPPGKSKSDGLFLVDPDSISYF